MLHIQFLHPVTPDAPRVGPVPEAVIDRERLLVGGERVATHQHNHWTRAGRDFTAVVVEGRVWVQFADGDGGAPVREGPFDGVKLVDGTIRHGDGFRDVLARLNEATALWELYSTPGGWARVTIAAEGR